MKKLSIGLIYGGKSTEHEVSIKSAKSILSVLDRGKYDINLIYINKNGEWFSSLDNKFIEEKDNFINGEKVRIENRGRLIGSNVDKTLDIVLPILHGTLGEDGTIQGLLELYGVPYVGCNVRSSAICMDKDITKKLLQIEGIKVANSVVVKYHEQDKINFNDTRDKLGLPMFVKPVNQGSSVGVSKVVDEKTFYDSIDSAFKYDTKIMIETEILGREIEISVLGDNPPFVSQPGEIIANTDFYSYESKYTDENGAALVIPASFDSNMEKLLKQTALTAFETLDCEGLARVDMFVTVDDEIYVNEVNTFPGFTNISMYPKLLESSGFEYTKVVEKLIDIAIHRQEIKSKLVHGLFL